jgi:hypothetical protein
MKQLFRLKTDKVRSATSPGEFLPEDSGLSVLRACEVEVGDILIFVKHNSTKAPQSSISTLRVDATEWADDNTTNVKINPGRPFETTLWEYERYIVLRGVN